MTRYRSSFLPWALVIIGSVVLRANASRADEKAQCVADYDRAQVLLKTNKLVEARAPLLSCGRPICPAFVSDDCSRWLTDLDARLPTVVVEAQGPDGQDITDVSIELDGAPYLSRIDGRAFPINPGEHKFVFRHDGAKTIERRVVVAESVRGRRISVRFESADTTSIPERPSSPEAAAPASPPPRQSPVKRPSTLTLALAGLGGVGLVSFAYFGLDYNSRLGDLDSCKPNCRTADTDRASVSRTLAFVSGGVGILALGAAVTLYLKEPAREAQPRPQANSHGVEVDVFQVPGGALACLRGQL